MKRLTKVDPKFEPYDEEECGELIRIQQALFIYRGIYASLEECSTLWSNYSNSVYASWIFLPKKLWEIITKIETADGFTSYEEWTKDIV